MDRIFKLPVGVALFAFLALAGLMGMLAAQSVMAQDAPPVIPNPTTVFSHNENSDGTITTYRATDPERKKIFWTLRGVDADYFTIDGGALRFKSTPDYEMPRGMALSGTNINTYKITVRSSAGGEDGAPDPTDDYDGDDLYELELTVNVQNIDEPGMVTLSQLQPQIGTRLKADLTDDDVQVGYGQWRWASSDSMNGPFTNYLTGWVDENLGPGANAYRPVDADLGKYLQVAVRYKDRVDDTIKTVHTVSTYQVRRDIVTSNDNPKYPDQRTLVGGTIIDREKTWRYIRENSPPETPVGAPVTAFDDERSIDVITYSLSDGTESSPADGTTNEHTKFSIDPATGQITVAAGAMLDRRDDIPDNSGTTTYYVTVTGTDGDGDSEVIAVTITVVKVDEPPVIDRVNVAGMLVAPTEMSHYEARRDVSPALEIDTNLDTATITPGTDDAVYRANDPEDGTANLDWSLEGDDGWLFEITPGDADTVVTPNMATATLAFKGEDELEDDYPDSPVLDDFDNFPDFENPRDKNRDNVYEITIVVTDSTLVNRDELDVTVKVINSTEDNRAGEVFLSNRQPEGASVLTATLEDDDTPIRSLKWQWYRSEAGTDTLPATCGAVADGVFTPATALIDANGAPVADAWT